MKRNATLNLKGLDPDVVEAARDVARRAGVPLETWIASVVGGEEKPLPQPRRKRQVDEAAASARSPEPVSAAGPETRKAANEPRRARASAAAARVTAPASPASADPFSAAISQMLRRLDAIDEKIDETHKVAQDAAAPVLEGSAPPVDAMAERLALIELRMTELGEQLTQTRPLGRRGRPAAIEMADAVDEIRQRQRELDEREAGPRGPNAVAAMQQNVAEGLGLARPQEPSPAIHELQQETTRLREAIGGLATGQDVNALEQAMLSLATGVQQAQKPADLAAIVKPIEMIQIQVSRLADDVAENVHARVAGEVERLAVKFDRALSAGPSGNADRDAMGGLFAEIEEIRRLIAALAGPERIQSLAQGLQALSGQIAKLQGDTAEDASRMAELRPLLEEIRSGLKAPKAEGIEKQIQAMGKKLDALRAQSPVGGAGSEAIIDRIDALSDKVDRVGASPVGDLLGRLEDLGETLRRPAVPGGDLATIHAMLHDLVDKVDRVGGSKNPGEGLDALEKQIVALSQRIDTRGNDPAIASLERSMNDLLTQVGTTPSRREDAEIGSLRESLAELRSQQALAEQRMQATLNGVHATLDRLTAHFGGTPAASIPLAEPAAAQRQPASNRRPEMPRPPTPPQPDTPAEWSRQKDEILEPGAGRPGRSRPGPSLDGAEPDATAPQNNDIKSNFIAAARRAALAAQAEAAEITPRDRLRGGSVDPRQSAAEAPGPEAGDRMPTRAAQLRTGIDKRRKHLLLGLAAIILALGTVQAVRIWAPAEAPVIEAKSEMPGPDTTASSPEPMPSMPSADPSRLEPSTTQSIAPPSEAASAPPANHTVPDEPSREGAKPALPGARKIVPRVADMSVLATDLAGVPTGLAAVRKAAIEGDGAAIYDLASRLADGRGVTRDLAVGAKLFEKLAAAGYAPAQYKLAGQYEKGLGLTRDLAVAKLWYGRAAEQGNVRSMHNLAVIYAENPSASGKPDFATAAQWFRRGAESGVRDSQYNLAVLNARGLGVPQDLVQSYLWFSAAAAQGDDDAAKKRDDVAAKLPAKDFATARGLAEAFKAKPVESFANEPPAAAASPAMTLLGAPTPAPTTTPKVAPTPRRI